MNYSTVPMAAMAPADNGTLRTSENGDSKSTVVVLVSEDRDLYRLTRDVLGELDYPNLKLVGSSGAAELERADIAILDWCPGSTQQVKLDRDTRRLYLIDREEIEQIDGSLPPTPVGILIKPLNRAVLKLSLQQVMASRDTTSAPQDRDEILQCLLQAYLRLQEYDYDRTNFLARAVFDLRAPLTAISGYCGLLLEGRIGLLSASQRDVLSRMERSARRLSRMALGIFDMTMGPAAATKLDLREESIEICIQQAVQETRGIGDQRDLRIVVQLSPSPIPLRFDAARLEYVLVNLLENACTFSPRHGTIEIDGYPFFWERRSNASGGPGRERRVRNSKDPNTFRIDIKDSGPAIPAPLLPLLFDEYISNSDPEERSGGGLGLAICKMIIRSHQGHIWAASGAEGVTFSLAIPFQWELNEPAWRTERGAAVATI
jgi:signal transduction histidine kinase